MITVLIGHRGVGKTGLLRRLAHLFHQRTDVILRDLDAEVETLHRKSIDEIFRKLGETEFRKLEAQAFENLLQTRVPGTQLIVALGAGFEFSLPVDAKVVWVRRPTDATGRIFLNRPALDEGAPLEQWQKRFPKRQERYRSLAHQELTLAEGNLHDFILEEHFFSLQVKSLPFALTALPENFKSPDFFEQRRRWGLKWLEVRDDLLTDSQIKKLQQNWPQANLLYAIRKSPVTQKPLAGAVDWPLEFGSPSFDPEIISIHEREASVQATLLKFPHQTSAILKLAITIESFDELMQGHRWWLQDPKKRAFLPSSQIGRWQWYRQLFGPQMPLHFFREGDGSSPDQPWLWQTLATPSMDRQFAAVLGSPIAHSWTPSFQREFFNERDIPVVAIEVGAEEWSQAIPVLQELGLRFAAVTSPHKQNAFALAVNHLSEEAKELESVNTLAFFDGRWFGHNTDDKGARGLFFGEFADDKPILVWGGGGTKEMLKVTLPKAEFASARDGKTLTGPVHLVWAVGRSREFKWPEPAVYVQDVIDLNYTEDSPGREIALLAGSPYKSGETMFIQQGLAQREFWKRYL